MSRWSYYLLGLGLCFCASPPAFADSIVVFNEVMYHPSGGGEDLEWVELFNELSFEMDISNWRLEGGIDYTFPEGTLIAAEGYLLIAKAPAAFQAHTGITNALGPCSGQLSNGGEELRLLNNSDRLMDMLDYRDDGDWPAAPDGSGATLAKLSPFTVSELAENWRSSTRVGGTPGAENFPADPEDPSPILINEMAAATNDTFWIELANLGGSALSVSGYVVAVAGDPAREHTLTNTSISSGGFLTLTETELGFAAADEEPVFLYAPGKGTVVDAQVTKNRRRGRSARHRARWLFPDVPTPGATNSFQFHNEVVINEIMYHHQGMVDDSSFTESDEEWIELYNSGTGSVELAGWTLDGGIDFEFPTGTVLTAGAYLVIARDAAALTAAHPGIEIIGNFFGRLSDRDELLTLKDGAGNPADEVHYFDGGRWPAFADGGGSSLELRNPDADNAVPEAWAASIESTNTPWRSYSTRGVAQASSVGPDNQWREFVLGLLDDGEVLLDDIRVTEDPAGAATPLISNGDFSSGLNDWRIIGNHRHSQVISDPDNPGNQVLRLVASGPTEHMHNHAETTLAGGQSVDSGTLYEIAFRAKWIAGSRRLNTRLYFNRRSRSFVLDAPLANGTPGRLNSTHVANGGPTFRDFGHLPAVPGADEAVTVSVIVADPDGLSAVAIWYAVDRGAWVAALMVHRGEGRYTALIPPQSASAVVQFYVQAKDKAGAVSTFPAAGPASRALYKVDDGLADARLHDIRIVMTPADTAFMHTAIQLMSNERLGATVIFDEREVYYNIGVRLKGSERGRVSDSRIGYMLHFNADRRLHGVHESVAIDRSSGQTVGQREMLINQVMNHAGGLLSKYSDLVKVHAPQSKHTSAAELQLARFGNVYLDEQFEEGGEGMVFEYELIYYPTTADAQGFKRPSPDSVIGTPINDKGDDPESYRWNFLIKQQRDRDAYETFLPFCKVFGMSGAAFNDQVGDVIDVDQWLRYFAFAIIDGHGDSYPSGGLHHNTMFYVRPADGRVLFFPHDMDFAYDANRSLTPNSDLNKIISTPGREQRYYGHVYDILTTTFNQTYMSTWTDRLGALLPGENFAGYLSYINSRHDFLIRELAGKVAWAYPFEVTSGGGTTTGAVAVVRGDGWIDLNEIRIANRPTPLELTWTSSGSGTGKTFTWSANVPVDPGSNTLTLLAYDFQGNLIGSNTLTIVSTAAERPLQDHLRITELMYDPAGGSDYEFIELCNTGSATLGLSNVFFNAGVTFAFTNPGASSLGPGAYTVVVGDLPAFSSRYDTNVIRIAGTFQGDLANGGETIEILGALNAPILDFTYRDGRGWPLAADGPGHALVPLDSAIADQQDGSLYYGGNWRAGTFMHGSPGGPDPAPSDGPTINEILAHTDFSNPAFPGYDSNDRIELFNTSTSDVALTHYYLSDDKDELMKWPVPTHLVVPARSWIDFDEVSGFHNPLTSGFGLDKAGEQVLLSYLPGTTSNRVVDAVRFKGQEPGISWGRYRDGDRFHYALTPSSNTLNTLPELRVVLSEIMYRPPDDPGDNTIDEYLELHNATAAAVDLWNPAGTWRIDGGVQYTFPSHTSMAPDEYLLLTSFDPTNTPLLHAFYTTYGLTSGQVRVMGPYEGSLNNRGERAALERPQAPDDEGPASWVIVDEALYFHRAPWPAETDGTGRPLQRKLTRWSGNDPDNWYAGFMPTPGLQTPVYGPAGLPDWWLAETHPAWTNDFERHALIDFDRDGAPTWLEYIAGTNPTDPSSMPALSIALVNGTTTVTFEGLRAGSDHNGRERLYTLQCSSNLSEAVFNSVPGFSDVMGNDETKAYALPPSTNAPLYFRLKTSLELQDP